MKKFAVLLLVLTEVAVRTAAAAESTPSANALAPYIARVDTEGDGMRVLNDMELSVAALQADELDVAKHALDDALTRIESIYANTESARRARTLWYAEAAKDFKGEPYERAMAYYYRGVADLLQGNAEDAFVAFNAGQLQDAFAEEEQFRCDFAVLFFLAGWSAQQRGTITRAEEQYARVAELRPGFVKPRPDDNLLIIVETGTAPRKLADGVGHYELLFRRGKDNRESSVKLQLQDTWLDAYRMEDVYWQASTRGSRPVDRIIKGKVVFQKNADVVGTTARGAAETVGILSGSSVAGSRADAAFTAVAVASLLLANKVNTKADTRAWRNLPDSVYILTAHVEDVPNAVPVDFLDSAGTRIAELSTSVPIVKAVKYAIGWIHDRAAVDAGPHAGIEK